MASLFENISKPSPKWFRIANTVYGNTETLVIAIMIIYGISSDSKSMLVFKLASSFFRTNIGLIMANGQEYAPVGATKALENATGQPVKEAIANDIATSSTK